MAEEIQSSKKAFSFRGKSLEELQALGVREFAKYLQARERRSVLRQFQVIEDFVTRAKKKLANKKPIKTHQRDIVVVPGLVGMRLNVHNGNTYVQVDVIGEMIGHRLGEFALTRSKVKHGGAGIGGSKGTKPAAKK